MVIWVFPHGISAAVNEYGLTPLTGMWNVQVNTCPYDRSLEPINRNDRNRNT